jgi:hypothetical protein
MVSGWSASGGLCPFASHPFVLEGRVMLKLAQIVRFKITEKELGVQTSAVLRY